MNVKTYQLHTCEQEFGQFYVMSMPNSEFTYDEVVQWAIEELEGNTKGS